MKSRSLLLASLLGVLPLATSAAPEATLVLHADQSGPVVHRHLFGQFAEHLGHLVYGGLWVGPDSHIPNTRGIRNDVLAALKNLHVPVVRWPGGCFADNYHWRNGVGPRNQRVPTLNSTWGGVVDTNQFGTHEFLDLCELIGADPYVCGNVGSGSVQEMADWVEYMTSDADTPMANLRRANGRAQPWKVPYFGVGNESWGCGGNMRPEFYADNYRRYQTFVKEFGGNRIFKIASGASDTNYRWTEVLMGEAATMMNGLSLHYYTVPSGNWEHKGSATAFGEDQWFSTLQKTLLLDGYLTRHSAIMDQFDPQKKVGLIVDEWGIWTDVEPGTNGAFLFQQNSLRDALAAALNLHLFQRHLDRVVMANIAQMINVLQAMMLTDGPKLVLTPTYHTFQMLSVHQDATSLPLELKTPDYTFGQESIPAVSAAASRDAAGRIHLSFVNANPREAIIVHCSLSGVAPKTVSGRVLTGPAMNACNTFAAPQTVQPQPFSGATLADGGLKVALPARSVVVLEL